MTSVLILLAPVAEHAAHTTVAALTAVEEIRRLFENRNHVAIHRTLCRQLIAEGLTAVGVAHLDEQLVGQRGRPARLCQVEHREAVGHCRFGRTPARVSSQIRDWKS